MLVSTYTSIKPTTRSMNVLRTRENSRWTWLTFCQCLVPAWEGNRRWWYAGQTPISWWNWVVHSSWGSPRILRYAGPDRTLDILRSVEWWTRNTRNHLSKGLPVSQLAITIIINSNVHKILLWRSMKGKETRKQENVSTEVFINKQKIRQKPPKRFQRW